MNATVLVLGILFIQFIGTSVASVFSTGDFNKDFFVTWSPSHVNTSADGHERSLKLDQLSGSGFASKDKFLFGQFDMKIKLIPGNSAGTVVAFYLSSNQTNRDEVDFEFLGNVVGQPYIVQTNVYVDGFDDREERINLWFDPTQDFHTYSILWNLHQIVFMVDWVPIRTHRNHADEGVPFPSSQPMSFQVSIWNGEDWATGGGKDKIDWSESPFVATFKNPKIDACIWKENNNARVFCRDESNSSSTLTWPQRRLFKWVRKYHLIYDYCQDFQRFHNNLPKECSLPKY